MQIRCPNCAFENPPGMKFCGMCGTQITQTCPACGTLNPVAFRFCGICGTSLGIATPPDSAQLPLQLTLPAAESPSASAPAARQAAANSLRLDGERKVVTVVMTDVTGSTNLLEQVGNETWVDLMNQILYVQERQVERFGGRVDQFRGDGLVAFFGADIAHEDDPERAILAGLSMHEAVQEYLVKRTVKIDVDLKLRVGVNTGEVILMDGVGNHRGEDTAMGEAISVASRMEISAQPGTVLVSEFTHHLVEARFTWRELGEIMVKGISQPIAVYQPLEPLVVDATPLSIMGSLETAIPMIGREKEFETLRQVIEGLYDGRGGVVLVSGEAGIGKSFLVNEANHYFKRRRALQAHTSEGGDQLIENLAWQRGRCRSFYHETPYSMWADMLRNRLDALGIDTLEKIQEYLYQEFQILFGDQSEDNYAYLATILGLPLDENLAGKVKHLGAEALQRQFFRLVRSWLAAQAAQGPMVLVFADIQWADITSLELLKTCLSISEELPLLWMLTYRPDRTSPAWEFQHYVETHYPHRLTLLNLLPLNYEQCQSFIASIFGEKVLPAETQKLIYKNSEGNPYYILELLRSLIDNGAIVLDSETGVWKMPAALTNLNIPASLHGLLQARIDGLQPEERHVLQLASVIGTTFWFIALETLVGSSFPLKKHLAALQRANLISERSRMPQLGMEYSFNTKLVRDAAYEGLLSSQLFAYHLKVAEFLEQSLDPVLLKQYEGMIAFHYRRAGNPNKELFYTLRAAERAVDVYANTEALDHCQRALELLEEMEGKSRNDDARYVIFTQRFEVLRLRHHLYDTLGDMTAGDVDARALLSLASQMKDDPAWTVDALLEQPEVHMLESKETLEQGLAYAEKALSLSVQMEDKHREMKSLFAIGNLFVLKRDLRWQETLTKALTLSRELGEKKEEANLLLAIGSAYGIDSLDRSQEYLEDALQVSQKLNDKRTELRLLAIMGHKYERSGDYFRWLNEFEIPRLKISRLIGDRIEEGFALVNCGQIKAIHLGNYLEGLPDIEESLKITESLTARFFPLLRLAQIQIELGKYKKASAFLEEVRPVAEQAVNYVGRAGYTLVSAMLNNTMGGEDHFQSALDLAAQVEQMVQNALISRQYSIGAFYSTSAAHLGLAALTSDEGVRADHHRQAIESSQRSMDTFNSFGFVQIIECSTEGIFYQHSQALAANGRQAEAKEMIERSYGEMMRKYELIPKDSQYRKTFLAIKLHQQITRLAETY